MASELTRDELVALRAHHERIRDMYPGSDFAATQDKAITVIDIALRALDTEADARLGRAVREWATPDSPDELEGYADVLARPHFLGSEKSPVVRLVRAIARVLREERDHA